jgi:serine protease Do
MTVKELESAIAEAAQDVGPAVVGLRRSGGGATGTIIEPGKVLTNAHNLRHEDVVVTFADGRSETGRVAGVDSDLDLAVLAVDTGDAQPIPLDPGGVSQVSVGRPILALSNPGGQGLHVTPGFVSSVAGSFRGPRGRVVRAAIEHTAPLPRGSSGGPLVDLDGRLLAINSVRMNPGLVLAIPLSETSAGRVAALGRGEEPRAPRLGVAVAPPRVARRLRSSVGLPDRDGVLIRAVQEESPADRAGLRRGDLIVAVAGDPLHGLDGLYQALEGVGPTGPLELTVVRGADEHQVAVTFPGPA